MIPPIATAISFLSRYSLVLSLSSIPDPVRDKLDATVRHFSHLVALSTIAVAMGVLMEGVELVHATIEWWERKRHKKSELIQLEELRQIIPIGDSVQKSSKAHSEEPIWTKLILRVGLILVVVGVVGEWRYGAKLEDAHEAVHQYDLGQILAADQEAGDAEDSAQEAKAAAISTNEELAKSKKQVAELDNDIKALRAQADEIRDEIAWRHVSSENAKKMRDATPASLRTLKVAVHHLLSDPEAGKYAGEIAEALKPVLDVSRTGGVMEPWGNIPTGIGLYVRSADTPGAGDVQRTLKAGGIDAPGALLSQYNLPTDSDIVIFVWPKPAPLPTKNSRSTAKK
jgi:hypothetical protein